MDHQLSADTIHQLALASHSDPFAVLGPHQQADRVVVRTLQPHSDKVELLTPTQSYPMTRLQEWGLYEVTLPALVSYKLRLHQGNHPVDIEDPYRFDALLSEDILQQFHCGQLWQAYDYLGAHTTTIDGVSGVRFTVWAPNARRVAVVGSFNQWDGRVHGMRNRNGVWELFLPGVAEGDLYKYEIKDSDGNTLPLKSDPYAFAAEQRPATASQVHSLGQYVWQDQSWLDQRQQRQSYQQPMSCYEVHLGSWQQHEDGSFLSYQELADQLIPYVQRLGFTHIELLPISEHPFDGSWGYQTLGLFAPTSRYGSPQDFAAFVDRCHQANIGVLIDWVPAHFPKDSHGLAQFDGTALYEHADPRQGYHHDWDTYIYNYGRNEVLCFLISNALFWLKHYHIDGLRVDAVASMLYLDYSRPTDQWIPNAHGGRENLEAMHMLRTLNQAIHDQCPGCVTIAEESTAWPGVSQPIADGGLGFDYKWNMGWMHDSLGYIQRDAIYRRYHHHELTFGLLYAFDEHFVLPLSHDEVVHGKGSLIQRMPGADAWQKFANLRSYFGMMWTHPGKKLLFMGGEFAQGREWAFAQGLDWHLLTIDWHQGVQQVVADLNRIYGDYPALHGQDHHHDGFQWLEANGEELSLYVFSRHDQQGNRVLVLCNFTPVTRHEYEVALPEAGEFTLLINTDDSRYGGSHVQPFAGNHHQSHCLNNQHRVHLTVPPLATVVLEWSAPGNP